MRPEHAGATYHIGDCGRHDAVPAMTAPVNLDWMRDPPPPSLTPFQSFFRNVDWEASSVGPMADWPRELKQVVRLMVADTSPRILHWGPNYTTMYNEAYIGMVGSKHPGMQGQDAYHIFPEFWPYFDTIISRQRTTGECLVGEADMFLMERHGFLEETYFDWKLVPIVGDDGEMKGDYGCPSDMTQQIIGSRRADCIQLLSHLTTKSATLEQLWSATIEGLSSNEKDTPFVLLYSVEEQMSLASLPSRPHYICRLQGSIGVASDHVVAKQYMDAQYDHDGLAPSVLSALTADAPLVLQASDPSLQQLLQGIDWKGYGSPSHEIAIVPLKSVNENIAFFVFGLNPYRRYNKLYQDLLLSIAEVVGPQISRIKLSAEVQRRAEMAQKATSAFEKSEQRFARFAARSTIGLAVAGLDRNLTYANDAWYSFAGLDPATSSYEGWLDTVHAEDLPLVQEWWAKVLSEKKGGQFQFRSKIPFRQGNKYSKNKTAICAVYPDLNEAQEIESVMGLVIDISELKWIEEQLTVRSKALEESESKWRNYAEHCPLGVVRTNAEGHVLYGNDAWHAYYGFTRGQVPEAQPWLPYLDESCLDDWKECYQSLKSHSGSKTMELKLKDKVYTVKDGDHVIEYSVYILVTGFSEFKEDGTVDYIDFWVTGNISAQKMAAKILADKMDEAIRLKTHQERFIDMISHEIRNPLSAVLHCGEEVVEAMKTCLEKLEMVSTCSSGTTAAGGRRAISQQIQNALDAANTIMYCVQHQKQIVDDVLTLSKLDGDLLVVSPVPVQPKNLVRTALQVFLPELKMTDIVLNIIEDETLQTLGINWVLLDPNRFLQIVINLVTNAIKFTRTSPVRKITITVSASSDPPSGEALGVHYVPRRYEAAKAISLTSDTPSEFNIFEEVYLRFKVDDTGKGLTPDEKVLLFNRFAQASPKTHIEYGGSGLGLFISRQITEMLGGEIGMCSSEGAGSTFAFYVKTHKSTPPRRPSVSIEPILELTRTLSLTSLTSPLVVPPTANDQNDGAIDIALAAPEPSSAVAAVRQVLVVEDNLVNQKVLCKLLRNRAFTVEAANHGQEALDTIGGRLRRGKGDMFDVILCDIEMPVMGGIEFAREVRTRESAGMMPGHIPIIGVTANVRTQQVSAAIEAGMDGVTTKPYRIDDLIAHVDRVCSTTVSSSN